MTNCSNCGSPLDVCNESQPFCARCGSPITSEHEPGLELADEVPSEVNDEVGEGKDWPCGVRLQDKLRTVCLRCGSYATGRSFLTCANSQCRATWRVNRCRGCKQPVDSRDPETPRCIKCGWLICASCLACNCPS
jgi:hypothetical protein